MQSNPPLYSCRTSPNPAISVRHRAQRGHWDHLEARGLRPIKLRTALVIGKQSCYILGYQNATACRKRESRLSESKMSVAILDSSAWREYRGRPANSGRNETTHLAKIADSTGKLHDCFVKLLVPNGPALLCEAMGWILAKASGVPCPAFAAIVMVPVGELRKYGSLPAQFDGMSLCPAWCSEVIAGKSVRQVHKMLFFIARGNCLRSKDARKIASFDHWSDLRDRNLGNVIRSANGGYVAIDHETLLHDLLWLPCGIRFEERSLLVEARAHLSTADFQRFQMDMAGAANGHAQALDEARDDLRDIIGKILSVDPAPIEESVMTALHRRSQPGWMSDELRVIA